MSRSTTTLFAAALLAHPASGLSLARVGGGSMRLHHPPRPCNPPTHVIASSRRQRHPRLAALRSGAQDDDAGRDSNAGGAIVEADVNDAPQQPPSAVASGGRRTDDQSLARALSLLGTSPRRIFLSLLSSTFIALAANLFGVTSALLAALPEEVSETTGLDSFYPRGGYKRVTVRGGGGVGAIGGGGSSSAKCSFLIPKEWVADTGLALAQARRRAVPLDYAMGSEKSSNVLPDAAYGPPGRLDDRGLSNGDTNVSVIVNTDVQQFRLASLGNGPREAAEKLYGSRRNIQMESAVEQRRGSDDNVPVYQFEYTVDRGEKAKPLRAISVVAGSVGGDAFVTLTVVSPAEAWEDPFVSERLRRVAESFKLV